MIVDPIDVLGYAATVVGSARFVPQVAHTAASGNITGVSGGMYAIMVAQAGAWIGYALQEGLIPPILINVVLATCGVAMLRLFVINRAPRIMLVIAALVAVVALQALIFMVAPAVLGICAAALAFGMLWPQVLVALRATDLSGLSRTSWWLSIANTLMWVGYGIGSGAPVLWLSAAQALVLSLVVLGRMLLLERRAQRQAAAALATMRMF